MSADPGPEIPAEPPETPFNTTETDHVTLVGSNEEETTVSPTRRRRATMSLVQPISFSIDPECFEATKTG